MRPSLVKFGNLCDEMEVFKRDRTGLPSAVKMGIAQEPQIVNEGVEVSDEILDRIGSLIAGGREVASEQIALLEGGPVGDKMAVQERIGANGALAV